MYSISLQPEFDTPDVLADYARSHGVGPGWLLLTGKPPDIELLRHRLGFVETNPVEDANLEAHIGTVRIANVPMHRWIMSPCPAQSDRDRAGREAGDPGDRVRLGRSDEARQCVIAHLPRAAWQPPAWQACASLVQVLSDVVGDPRPVTTRPEPLRFRRGRLPSMKAAMERIQSDGGSAGRNRRRSPE